MFHTLDNYSVHTQLYKEYPWYSGFFKVNQAVFFSGAGDFYCSGNDLGNFMNIPPDGIKAMADKGGEILE